MDGADVRAAARSCRDLLEPLLDRDWTAPVPELDFTVASVLAHATECVAWYALDAWGGTTDDAPFSLAVKTDAGNPAVLLGLTVAAQVCAASIEAAPADLRGFHPFGSPDPNGFAAIACDELLVHGDDAARGLGLRLTPDADLAARVLARLYPWHEVVDGDPWRTLLWANGRIDLPGRPHQRGWRWHTAPLSEWDGQSPA